MSSFHCSNASCKRSVFRKGGATDPINGMIVNTTFGTRYNFSFNILSTSPNYFFGSTVGSLKSYCRIDASDLFVPATPIFRTASKSTLSCFDCLYSIDALINVILAAVFCRSELRGISQQHIVHYCIVFLRNRPLRLIR